MVVVPMMTDEQAPASSEVRNMTFCFDPGVDSSEVRVDASQ